MNLELSKWSCERTTHVHLTGKVRLPNVPTYVSDGKSSVVTHSCDGDTQSAKHQLRVVSRNFEMLKGTHLI